MAVFERIEDGTSFVFVRGFNRERGNDTGSSVCSFYIEYINIIYREAVENDKTKDILEERNRQVELKARNEKQRAHLSDTRKTHLNNAKVRASRL